MYEEYQNNPNPGFDPRQRYEDAGGYLRSILGSFLNQKKATEDKDLEESRYQAQLGMEREKMDRIGPEAERRAAEADILAFQQAGGLEPSSPEVLSYRESRTTPGYNTYRSADVRADASRDVAAQRGETELAVTDKKIGGQQSVAAAQQAGANERSAEANATKITTAGMSGGAGAAKEGFSPTMSADSFRLNNIAANAKKIKNMATKAGDLDTATTYEVLAKFLTDSIKEVKTKTFSQAQGEALDRLEEALSSGTILTEQMLKDFVAAWGLPDRDPNAPVPPPVNPAEFGTTWDGIKKEPEIISQDGRRFLKEDGQMYEMLMG